MHKKMAFLAGNLGIKISFGLQNRVFVIPWVKKNRAILGLKGRDCSSSVPIRYIPRKSVKKHQLESLPTKGLEKAECYENLDSTALRTRSPLGGEGAGRSKDVPQTRNGQPNFLFNYGGEEMGGEMDHDLGVINYDFLEEPEEVVDEIKIYKEVDVGEQHALRANKSTQEAEKLAIELLATRAFTAAEMRKRLYGKRFSSDIVETVINDFQSRGLINDSFYAEAFSRSRWSSSTWGPRRIKQALYKKGVSEVDAEKAMKLVFQEGEPHSDQESKHGMSKLSMDHLYVQASKQWHRGQDIPKETRKMRIVRWLQYRGFSWGVINFIIKKLESEFPP